MRWLLVFPNEIVANYSSRQLWEMRFAMIYDDYPLDPDQSGVEQNGETTNEENIVAYMNSQIAKAVFEAELEAMAQGEFPGPTPHFGEWTEAHELMAEVESPSFMGMDTSRGELFPEDEELGHLLREQGRQFAGVGDLPRRRVRPVTLARQFTSGHGVARRIRRPRETGSIQKRPRKAAYFPLASRRMDPGDR